MRQVTRTGTALAVILVAIGMGPLGAFLFNLSKGLWGDWRDRARR